MASGSAKNCLPVWCQPHIVSILDYYLSRTKSSQWPVVLSKIAYQFGASHILYPIQSVASGSAKNCLPVWCQPHIVSNPVGGQWFCQKLLTSLVPATYCIQSSQWPVVLPKIAYQFCQPHIVSILDYYLSRTKSSQWPVVLPKIAYQFSASPILYPFLTIIYQEPDPVSGQWFCRKLLTSFLPATYCIHS